MNSFELTAENILRDYGCYFHKTHTSTVCTRRARKFQAFIEGLGRTPTWIYENVSIITCTNFYNPPEQFRGRASKHIGGTDHNHLWAVLPPVLGHVEWLEDFLDHRICREFEVHQLDAELHIEEIRTYFNDRLKLIKGEG